MGDLSIPKHSADLEETEAALKIYYEAGDWLESAEFISKLKILIGGEQYGSSYPKKSQISRYFGFVTSEDFSNAQSRRKITESGRRFYEALRDGNKVVMHEELMQALETVPFGRNNCAVLSDSDIEAPALLMRTILFLKYVTTDEFSFLLWAINDDSQYFFDAIQKVLSKRSGGILSFPDGFKKYDDQKSTLILVRWGFLEQTSDAPKKISIAPEVLTRFEHRLANLKIYNSDGSKEPHLYPSVNANNCAMKFDGVLFDLGKFIADLNKAGLQVPAEMSTRFVAALLTKPFVLLTGLSGSGKSKLAEAFAKWFDFGVENDASETCLETEVNYTENAVTRSFGWTLNKAAIAALVNKDDLDLRAEIGGVTVNKGKLRFINQFYFTADPDKDQIVEALKAKYSEGEKMSLKLFLPSNKGARSSKRYKMVPVGADWTSRDPILGYPNALKSGEYVNPDNGILDLLISAANHPELPFFLILDEMNLSHVEKYFADFLSAMESGGDVFLHTEGEGWEKSCIPDKVKIPRNFFIIGTVNVDETTYMFSPKVLDRANVIEFRITDAEMAAFLQNLDRPDLDKISGGGAGMAQDFVRLSAQSYDGGGVGDEVRNGLKLFFSELKEIGAEFGFRSAFEIYRFAGVLRHLVPAVSANDVIDAAVMQKLLPKLHGSRSKLEGVLEKLAGLCLINQQDLVVLMKEPRLSDYRGDSGRVKFPLSFEKIRRMHFRLIKDGFVSFAEA